MYPRGRCWGGGGCLHVSQLEGFSLSLGNEQSGSNGEGERGFGRTSVVPCPQPWPLLASCGSVKRPERSTGVHCARGWISSKESASGRGGKRAVVEKSRQKEA